MAIAREHDLKVIEDCAHAIETEYRGQKAGTIGDLGVLSFYSTKNIVTGEGGMVLTRDRSSRSAPRCMGLHGMSPTPGSASPTTATSTTTSRKSASSTT
jgi:dTDP-4-amino-4,6-dideoxygalactose transaminase